MKGKALAVIIPLALGVVGVYVLLARGMSRGKAKDAEVAAEPALREAAAYDLEHDQFAYAKVRRKKQATPERFTAAIPTTVADEERWQREHTRFPPYGWFRARLCAGEPTAIARYEAAFAAAEEGVALATLFACPEGNTGYCDHAVAKLVPGGPPEAWRRPLVSCTDGRHDAAFAAAHVPDTLVIERFRQARSRRPVAIDERLLVAVGNMVAAENVYAADAVDDLAATGEPKAIDALLAMHDQAKGEMRAVIARSLGGVADPRARKVFKAFCRRDPDADECYEAEDDGRQTEEEAARYGRLEDVVRAQDTWDLATIVRLVPGDRVEQLDEALAACAGAESWEGVSAAERVSCIAELRRIDPDRAQRAASSVAPLVDLQPTARGLLAEGRFFDEGTLVAHLRGAGLLGAADIPDLAPRYSFPSASELMISAGRGVRLPNGGGDFPTLAALTTVGRIAGLDLVFDVDAREDELELRAWDGTMRWAADATGDDLDLDAIVGFVNELAARRASETRCIVETEEEYTTIVVCGPRRELRLAVDEKLLGNTRHD